MLTNVKPKYRIFYGWVVVLAFSIIGTSLFGVRLTFGVFFKSIEGEFNLTRAATSSVFSAYMVFGVIFVILIGWAVDKYGPRIVILLMGILTGISLLSISQSNSLWQLFITYSLLLAMGTSAIYLVIISTVSRWFNRKRGLALGIASLGSGLGPLIIAPFATYLISNFNWRIAYIVIGLIAWLIVIPLSRLLKKEPSEIGTVPDGVESGLTNKQPHQLKNKEDTVYPTDFSLLQALRTRSFWLLISTYFLFSSSHFLVITHIVPHAIDFGFSAGEAATIISLIGGSSIAGRLIMGGVSDRIGKKLTFIICALVESVAVVWLLWSYELRIFYLLAVIYGFGFGGWGPIMGSLVGDTFGLRNMGAILGVTEVGFNIGAAVGTAMGGLIFDISQSYFMAFLLTALSLFVGTLLLVSVRRETFQT
ncbi:MFS transporter [Chloroflexota bacterium]